MKRQNLRGICSHRRGRSSIIGDRLRFECRLIGLAVTEIAGPSHPALQISESQVGLSCVLEFAALVHSDAFLDRYEALPEEYVVDVTSPLDFKLQVEGRL